MIRNSLIIVIIVFVTIIVSCTNKNSRKIERFSIEKPYAIQIALERSYYQADKLSDRLFKMGIDAYVVHNEDSLKDTGSWYYVLCGSIESLDSATVNRERIEQKYHLKSKDLKIVTFSNFSDTSIVIKKQINSEQKRVSSKKPDVKDEIFQIMQKFPESNSLFIQRAYIFNTPSDIEDMRGFGSFYSANLDLPRGIKRKSMLKQMEAFSEVIYKDNLYGDRVTIDIGKLRGSTIDPIVPASIANNGSSDAYSIAIIYADLILETGDYLFEEKNKIEINSYTKLFGYKVTIEPKRDYFRTYFILVDPECQYVIFSQSTEKTEADLIEILSDIGKGDGLLNYDEFYNTFYTIPENLIEGDLFIGFEIDKLDWTYARGKGNARWAKEYVGHWNAKGYFYNEKKGLWTYGVFDVLTNSRQQYIERLYKRNTKAATVKVYGTTGNIIYTRRFNNRTWQYYKMVSEINFGIGRYTCMVDNSNKSWLNKEDLIIRAEALQFEAGKNDTLYASSN